jgi:hypothetical protein
MKQDQLVESAARRGLPCVVLCPPNISGPYSAFMVQLVDAMRSGEFALVDGGRTPCSLIDVQNLVHAIRLALSCETADGRRIFVTDSPPVSWGEVADALADVCQGQHVAGSLGLEEAARLVREKKPPRPSVLRALKHLASSEVRDVLCRDRLLGSMEACVKRVAERLPSGVQDWLRSGDAEAVPRAPANGNPQYSKRHVRTQLRNVRYSLHRAAEILGYEPIVDFPESIRGFKRWYKALCGWEDESWALLSQLY